MVVGRGCAGSQAMPLNRICPIDKESPSAVSAQREGHGTAPGMLDPQVPLAAGSRAPHFTLHDGAHSTMGLTDLLGRAAVLVFYVADWPPVASDQLGQLAELPLEFDRLGSTVVGL